MDPRELERRIEEKLERLLAPRSGAPREDSHRAPPRLEQSIRYSLLAPGKRIRPRLALACAPMVGASADTALSAAIAIEMVHCFTLIHDDLPSMDNDDFRRGKPSNHKVYGEALALLAGDALMALAIEALLEAPEPSERVLAAVRTLTWAMGARGVVGGQAAELELRPESTVQALRSMHAMKTGALFAAALLLPADLGGLDRASASRTALTDFALALGLAFQTLDDLEDSAEDSALASILHFIPEAQARTEAKLALTSASEALFLAFGAEAREVLEIAGEVERKL